MLWKGQGSTLNWRDMKNENLNKFSGLQVYNGFTYRRSSEVTGATPLKALNFEVADY